jgi:hypothetical protein
MNWTFLPVDMDFVLPGPRVGFFVFSFFRSRSSCNSDSNSNKLYTVIIFQAQRTNHLPTLDPQGTRWERGLYACPCRSMVTGHGYISHGQV